jgi:hypothetical protein
MDAQEIQWFCEHTPSGPFSGFDQRPDLKGFFEHIHWLVFDLCLQKSSLVDKQAQIEQP